MEKKTRIALTSAARAKIQNALYRKGITQRELASQITVNEVSMSRYLRGDTGIPEDKLAPMCEALDLDKEELLRMDERVVVTMTRDQARAVMNATELLARLYIGQTFTMTELLCDLSRGDYWDRRDMAKEALDLAMKIMVGANEYNNPDIKEKPIEHERLWAIYATIRHAISWHDYPEGGNTVDFYTPMGYGEPMPKCEIIDLKKEE